MSAQENATNNPNPPLPPTPEALAVTIVEEKPEPKEEIPEKNPPAPADEPKKILIKRGVQALKSKKLVLPIALLTFLLSIPILFSAIWLLYIQHYDCEGLLKSLPKLQIGIAIGLFFIFFLSNAVIYARARFPLPGLIVIIMVLILTLVVGLGIDGEFKMESSRIVASPRWLQIKVHNSNNWNGIKSCIYQTRTCKDLISRSYLLNSYGIMMNNLSPVESGCCTPPAICGMECVNATYWRRPYRDIDGPIPYNRDCDLWQNDESRLCYDCNSCKQGFVKTLEGKWSKLGTFLSAMSLLLMISHLMLFVATMWEQQYGD